MAASRAKTEEVIWNMATGVMLNGNLLDYKIATMLDCGPIETIIVKTGLGYGPYRTISSVRMLPIFAPYSWGLRSTTPSAWQ